MDHKRWVKFDKSVKCSRWLQFYTDPHFFKRIKPSVAAQIQCRSRVTIPPVRVESQVTGVRVAVESKSFKTNKKQKTESPNSSLTQITRLLFF